MKSLTASFRQRRTKSNACIATLFCVIFFSCFTITNSCAQTLFTYGKHAVTKEEFLKAYNKNNTDTSGQRISYENYLELYSRFKLKVQAARDAGLDTSADQINELESFRYQLADNFLKDDASIKLLVDEAFERSQKDINISFIFSPVYTSDSNEIRTAQKKINDAYSQLQNGGDWDQVASAFDHGDPGFITVFVLPYVIENAAYNTAEGKYSKPVKARNGYYIIKNNKERKAVGKIRVAQILLAFHPNMSNEARKQLRERADSLHNDLLEGGIFADSAKRYSNDNATYQNGGEMPAFGVGEYDTAFTNAAFALQKDGDISSPIATSFGYHILLRLQKIDVIADTANEANMLMLKEKVMQSDRMQLAQATLINDIRKKIAKDATPSQMDTDSAALDYYRRHLEKYNSTFADQLNEFKEGNLLFAMMQRKVWDAASADSAGLRKYYEDHKEKYVWELSADALIITCIDPGMVDSIQNKLKSNVADWRQLADQSNGMVNADSGRFELGQIPVVERTNFTEGLFTAPVINEQDSSKTFAYIIRMHNEKGTKNFEDARGAVINDYQQYLEEQWVATLKKKYPVKINKKTFKTLSNPN